MDAITRPAGTPLDFYENQTAEVVRLLDTVSLFVAARRAADATRNADRYVSVELQAVHAEMVCPVLGHGSALDVSHRLGLIRNVEQHVRSAHRIATICHDAVAAGQPPDDRTLWEGQGALHRLGLLAAGKRSAPVFSHDGSASDVASAETYRADYDAFVELAGPLADTFRAARRAMRRLLLPLSAPDVTVDDGQPLHLYVCDLDRLPVGICWERRMVETRSMFVARPWEAAAVPQARDLGEVPDGYSEQDVSDTLEKVMASATLSHDRSDMYVNHVADVTLALLSH